MVGSPDPSALPLTLESVNGIRHTLQRGRSGQILHKKFLFFPAFNCGCSPMLGKQSELVIVLLLQYAKDLTIVPLSFLGKSFQPQWIQSSTIQLQQYDHISNIEIETFLKAIESYALN